MKVLVASPWIPAEWIKAHGHEPCGIWFHPAYRAERPATTAGMCPFAQRAASAAQSNRDLAFVFATHCDQLRRACDSVGTPDLQSGSSFLLNFPSTWQTGCALKLLSAEMERLGEFLVRIGGHAPAPRELATQMHAYRALRTELASAADWCFGSAYADAIAHFHSQGSFKLPSPDKFKETATARNPEQKPRLALVGGPLDADGLRLFREIERLGGIVVLNATETGERSLAPRTPEGTGVSDAPAGEGGGSTARELSRILLEQCVDVFQRPNSRLYAWLEPRIVKRRVQGIILWHHVGCDLWRAEAESIREAFKLPLLLLEAEDTGSIDQRTISRVQAFLEALR